MVEVETPGFNSTKKAVERPHPYTKNMKKQLTVGKLFIIRNIHTIDDVNFELSTVQSKFFSWFSPI